MKLILAAVNAKYIHSNLAVYSLKASALKALKEQGQEGKLQIEICEFTINQYVDDILAKLYKEKADVIAFSCYIWNRTMVEDLMELIHQTAPHTQIWVGGPEVSFDAEDVLARDPMVKLVMRGEGEATFSELTLACAKAYRGSCGFLSDSILEQIAGITFRNERGEIRRTPDRLPVVMDKIPFPYENMSSFQNKIIYYESSRGCPFSCSYCLSSIDKHLRFRSLDLVEKELQFFLDQEVPQVKFVDRTFNCRPDRTMEIWAYIRDHDNGRTNFHFEITAELLTEEELDLLASFRPGLAQLEIGVQSTNQQTIHEIDRRMDFTNLSRIVNRISAGHNVHQHLDLIAGLPYENLQSFRKSFNDIYALHPQQLQLGFLKVLKGSKMHRVSGQYGLIYHTKPVYEVISTRWVSYDDILLLKGVEDMVEVYYNSCQFRCSLAYLGHFYDEPFSLFLSLAQYYEKQGLSDIKQTKMERYQILRDFAAQTIAQGALEIRMSRDDQESTSQDTKDVFAESESASMQEAFDPHLFDEILLYDLYLRENLKSRPFWAADTGHYKKEVADFYCSAEVREKYFADREENSYKEIRHRTHVEIFDYDIEESAREGKARDFSAGDQKGKRGILFDYEKRDPLTYEAKAVVLNELFFEFE